MLYQPYTDCQIPQLGLIYQAIFGYKTDGVFVEVGAYDGISVSNTAFLADLGWSGLYIEPMPDLYALCVQNHLHQPSIRTANYAVGDGSMVQFLHNHPQHLYTGDPALAAALYATVDRGLALTVRLDTLLLDYHVNPGFDLLVIDVEGMELAVLDGLCIGLWQPTMVIIEAHEFSCNPALNCHAAQINEWFEAHGYIQVYVDAINSIFVLGWLGQV